MAREGFEDYKRWKSDKTDNSQLSQCYHGGEFAETQWKDIRQGDYIKIYKDEVIPADVMVLISSGASGISYVETASLDGEKNLKPKFSLAALQRSYNTSNDLTIPSLSGNVRCINPTAEIESFEG